MGEMGPEGAEEEVEEMSSAPGRGLPFGGLDGRV